ncbi:MAG: ABC transporter permease, partial [Gemmatimonadota bacterium]|nr:ABC transporter permease [Gemmatimonadota bacterium]
VVLTARLSARLTERPAAEAIGRQVRLRGRDRTIIGVREARNGERAGTAFVPLEAESDALAPTPRPRARDLVLQARTVEEVAVVQRGVEAWLASRYGDWRRVIRVTSNQARVAQAAQGFLVFKLALGAITGISLLVGGIGIMNVLLAAVTERTREIGIRKAVGARRREVLVQFLAESVAISGLGSGVGAAIGMAGAFAITSFIRSRTEAQVYAAFSWGTLAVAAGAALLVGVVFGMYPALRASRLPPVEAIRHE